MFSRIRDNSLYIGDVEFIANLPIDWGNLSGKNFLISGASGLIGTLLTDVLIRKNCRVHALGRSFEKARDRFGIYMNGENFAFTGHDINEPLNFTGKYDFVIHLASNTHPLLYSSDPVGTITANIIGLNNMLRFAVSHGTERFLFASSVEIYGENRGDTELFDENYCGNIDISRARSGYTESKRCGEALCQSYIQQYGLDIVIPRFSRTYGPTMQMSDSKAVAQFIKNGLKRENIIIKSKGNQFYSYSYAADAVSALLIILVNGKNGGAYNVADSESDITLRDLADLIAKLSWTSVIFELPPESERLGYSLASKARLNSDKLKSLGWRSHYDIKRGITRTLEILRNCL